MTNNLAGKVREAHRTRINPNLTALAAKIDEAKAYEDELWVPVLIENKKRNRRLDDAAMEVLHLQEKLVKAVAGNIDELRLKARYVDELRVYDFVARSIIRDLLALSRKPEAS